MDMKNSIPDQAPDCNVSTLLTEMTALVKSDAGTALATVPVPRAEAADDVVIRVVVAGICRTDIFAAAGRLVTAPTVVLGHEFSGVITETGTTVNQVRAGERVTVMPVLPCGVCDLCREGKKMLCQDTRMLGIDRDGCYCGFVRVPATCVHKLPDGMSFRIGAYAEPVAAAMSVLRAGLIFATQVQQLAEVIVTVS